MPSEPSSSARDDCPRCEVLAEQLDYHRGEEERFIAHTDRLWLALVLQPIVLLLLMWGLSRAVS